MAAKRTLGPVESPKRDAGGVLPAVGGEENDWIAGLPANELESETKARIVKALERVGVAVWNNPVGRGRAPSGMWMQWGLCKGSADLIGLAPPYGRFLAIETKRPKGGEEARHQEEWLAFVRSMKGVAGFARSVEEALELANEARLLP